MTVTTEQTSPRTIQRRTVVLLAMCVGYFLVLLDVTIVNVALPAIGDGVGAGTSGLQWVVDGYAVALAGLMLLGGSIGDLRGHRRVVLAGLALFGLASLGCGLSSSVGMLIACRALQGTGAAMMLPGTLAIITNAYPDDRERARAIGIWAGVGSSALAAGPLLGGLLVQTIGWRWVFLLNVPLVAIAFAVAARVVAKQRPASTDRVDWAGAMLAAASLTSVTFAFIEGGRNGLSAITVLAGIVAVLTAASFVVVERCVAAPLLPLGLFRDPGFVAANAVAGVMNLATLGLLFVIALYLQDVRHHSPLTAGVALLPLFLPLSVLAPLGGRLTARHGPRLPMLIGLTTTAVGFALLLTPDERSSYLTLLPALLLWGSGLAILTPAVVAAAIGAVPAARAGLASAVNNTTRQAAGAIGIAGFGALAANPGSRELLTGLHTAATIAALLFLAAVVTTALVIGRRTPH